MQCTYLALTLGALMTLTSAVASAKDQEEQRIGAAQFEAPIRLKAGDDFIDTGKYSAHAGPLALDLNADGKLDLLVGNFDGHFQMSMNIGTRAKPVYENNGLLQVNGEAVTIPNW